MASLAAFYAAGGIWMHFIAFFAFCSLAALVFQVRRPALELKVAVFGSMALAVLFGLFGTFFGLLELFTFVVARPSARDSLLYQGLALAWNPILFALAVVIALCLAAVPIEQWRRLRHAPVAQAAAAKRAA